MLAYTVVGSTDLAKACEFYEALLQPLGVKQMFGLDRIKFFGTDAGGAMLAVCTPANGEPHAVGNGHMISFPGGSKEGVDALYKKALEIGGSDAGAPEQLLPTAYGGYVRDLDGNKIGFIHFSEA